VVGTQDFVEHGTISELTIGGIGAEGKIGRVWSKRGIAASVRVARMAGPGEFGGLCDHRCPDRIQLDISMAGENVALAADEARRVAAFPQWCGASMPGVEFGDIESANSLHHPRNGAGCFRRGEQV